MRTGKPSPKYGHLGVWFHSTGPSGPVPGDRLRVVVYDRDDRIVRRFEQIEGRMLDPGYVDFFNSARCRPAVSEMPLVDIAPDGTQTVLVQHVPPGRADLIAPAFRTWAATHGIHSSP